METRGSRPAGTTRVVLADAAGLEDVAVALDATGVRWVRSLEAAPDARVVIGTAEALMPLLGVPGRVGLAVTEGGRPPVFGPGLDYVLRRPLDPQALRLLLAHLLDESSERRGARRAAVDLRVPARLGLRRLEARMLEVSATGARLALPRRAAVGRRLRFQLPASGDGARACWIGGRVVRFEPDGRGGFAGVAFTEVPLAAQGRLRLLADPPRPSERRRDARHVYGRRVIARGAARPQVLLGRDLSMGGMRVASDGSLDVGSELEIALHVRAGGVPLVVRCEVARDDGPRGVFLRFQKLSDAERSYLAGMVSELPGLEAQSGSVVVSEVVPQGG